MSTPADLEGSEAVPSTPASFSRRGWRLLTGALSWRGGWAFLGIVLLLLYGDWLCQWLLRLVAGPEVRWGISGNVYLFISTPAFVLLPLILSAWTWAQVRAMAREDSFAGLVLSPAPRGEILRSGIRGASFMALAIPMLVLPLLVSQEVPLLRCPLTPLIFAAPNTWVTELIDGRPFSWWFTTGYGLGVDKGWPCMVAVALVGLQCSLRWAVAASARCAVAGRASRRSLFWALLWSAAPVVAGLLLAHLVQLFVILPNEYGVAHLIPQPLLAILPDQFSTVSDTNWFGTWINGKERAPFNYACAAMCGLAILPTALAALFSGRLLRSAARQLDGLVTD